MKPSFGDLFQSSIRSILKNKSRTILTSLGIIIGVTSVILLTSIGNGLQDYINSQFESLGSNLIFITPGQVFNDKGGFSQNASSRYVTISFTDKDTQNIQRGVKNIIILPINTTQADVKYSNTIKKNIAIVGTTEEYAKNVNTLPNKGSWFTKDDDDKKNNVVILGYQTAQDLFGNQNSIGRKIIINSRNFKVIGTIEKKGSSFGGPDQDNRIYMPFQTVSTLIGNNDIQEIVIKSKDKNNVDFVKKEVKKILLKNYKEDSFSVFDSSQLLSSINSIISILTVALSGIAAISLVVGGIGIMNIMLVSVTERTKEIGLRKAIGAPPQAILIQFLIEAVILSCLGGLVGILLGFLGTLAINPFFPAKITLSSVLLAFGVSSIVGIVFGVAPARKASKLSPIEALRYE
jgi:putative ABC transport system permease protein